MCAFVCSISIYKSSQGCKKVRLQHFYAPDKSTVMSLACSPQGLYAGLVNGSVASYTKAPGKHPRSALTLGSKSVSPWGLSLLFPNLRNVLLSERALMDTREVSLKLVSRGFFPFHSDSD